MTENEISYIIRGSIFNVYNELGPGLLETVYRTALHQDIVGAGLKVRSEVPIPAIYKGIDMGIGYRADLVVENKVIVEVKSIEAIHKVHHKQVLTYLRLTNLHLGILVNFNTEAIKNQIFRKVLGLPE